MQKVFKTVVGPEWPNYWDDFVTFARRPQFYCVRCSNIFMRAKTMTHLHRAKTLQHAV